MPNKKTLAGYCRVSTTRQEESIERQKEAIKKYCDAYGYNIELFIDDGVSAYKYRPQFEKMMSNLNDFNGVIVTDLTRFGRSTEDLLVNINKIKGGGKAFITINQHIDTSTKEGKLQLTVLSAIADFERDATVERLTEGRAWAKVHGTKSGKPLHRPLKEVNWQRFNELKKLGLSLSKIAPQLGMSKTTLYKKIPKIGSYV